MAPTGCTGCGAELTLRCTTCPLCGTDSTVEAPARPVSDLETYQSEVRDLRDQLKVLRDEAKAV